MLRPIGPPHLGDSASVEILVPESEVDEANEIIALLSVMWNNMLSAFKGKQKYMTVSPRNRLRGEFPITCGHAAMPAEDDFQ